MFNVSIAIIHVIDTDTVMDNDADVLEVTVAKATPVNGKCNHYMYLVQSFIHVYLHRRC